MAKSKTYTTDTGVSIYVPGRTDPIRVNAGEPYETSDEQEQDALDASTEVTSSKGSEKSEKGSEKGSKSDG